MSPVSVRGARGKHECTMSHGTVLLALCRARHQSVWRRR